MGCSTVSLPFRLSCCVFLFLFPLLTRFLLSFTYLCPPRAPSVFFFFSLYNAILLFFFFCLPCVLTVRLSLPRFCLSNASPVSLCLYNISLSCARPCNSSVSVLCSVSSLTYICIAIRVLFSFVCLSVSFDCGISLTWFLSVLSSFS